MDNKELREIADTILTEMYAEAEPPLDFMELKENPDEAEDGWYENHYLPTERQREIFDKHTEGVELSKSEHMQLTMTCILDLGPASTRPEDR